MKRPGSVAMMLACGLLLAVAGVVTACSDDNEGNGDCEESILDAKAQLSVQDDVGPAKASYAFDVQTLSGGARLFSFKVKNTAGVLSARPLEIVSVQIEETDGSGQPVDSAGFACLAEGGKSCATYDFPPVVPEGWLASAKCPPDGAKTSTEFVIRYQHDPSHGARKARVSIKVTGDPDQSDKPLVIEFATAEGAPRLKCQKDVIEFGILKKGASACELLKCTNTGSAPLKILKAELISSTDPPLEVTFATASVKLNVDYEGSPEVVVPEGGALPFNICLKSVPDDSKIGATLRLTSNDLEEPSRKILIQANSTGPCYTTLPGDITWAKVAVGNSIPQEVKLKPCGTEKVFIASIELEADGDQDFKLDFATASFPASQHISGPTAAAPLEIVPGGSTPFFRVRCEPSQMSATPLVGEVKLTDDKGETKTVSLSCQPFQLAKPEACFEVHMGGQKLGPKTPVIPQTPLSFKCDCSKAPGTGQITGFDWTLKQPAGFKGVLVPSPKACPVGFTPNVAGSYEFCLKVTDSAGNASAPYCVTLEVVPDNKIHIELTWTQLNDKDPNDKKGSDLDLHLAHPLAPNVLTKDLMTGKYQTQKDHDGDGNQDPWFAQCYDCFWLNCPANSPKPAEWPINGNLKDNPQVDLDDTDGWGPENISIESPQTNGGYWVGVYVWDDAGMGPSVPTVTVYRDKVVLEKIVGPPLSPEDMWCVGRIKWDPQSPNPNKDWLPCPGAKPNKPLVTKSYPNPAKNPATFPLTCENLQFQ